jgi:hypothetical protein
MKNVTLQKGAAPDGKQPEGILWHYTVWKCLLRMMEVRFV